MPCVFEDNISVRAFQRNYPVPISVNRKNGTVDILDAVPANHHVTKCSNLRWTTGTSHFDKARLCVTSKRSKTPPDQGTPRPKAKHKVRNERTKPFHPSIRQRKPRWL